MTSPTPLRNAAVAADKAAIRSTVKAALRTADATQLAAQSDAVCARVLAHASLCSARRVVCYIACARLREVDTGAIVSALLRRDVALYVPVVKDQSSNMAMLRIRSLEGLQSMPPFGILEPGELDDEGVPREDVLRDGLVPDVVVLPGLAFDTACGRLGRGGGYYDKFLAGLDALLGGAPRPVLMGIAFREQMVDAVPMDEHDCRCDVVITADEVHRRR